MRFRPAVGLCFVTEKDQRDKFLQIHLVLYELNRRGFGVAAAVGFFLSYVAEPGVEPGLEDYEPSVQPYTTPHAF